MHQGVLIGALATFPIGRPRRFVQYAALAGGALVATGYLGQAGAAAGLLMTAAIAANRMIFPRLAAGVVGSWLAGTFIWSRVWPETFQPSRELLGYEFILLGVALTLPWGLGAEVRRRGAFTDRVLAAGPAGLSGLEHALRRTLRRRALQLTRNGDDVVVEGLVTIDDETSAAIERAIALTVAHERALAESSQRLHELEAARVRLLTAADIEREQAARRLRHELATLRSCSASVADTPEVVRELAAAVADVERIVAGLPPEGLGGGGIGSALAQLCARHPVPASLVCDEDATGDAATETALYYVCSEALANSAKHAAARLARVTLSAGTELVLTIVDDGVGGAHLGGSGLAGMQDRLAAIGGTLVVESGPGTGTRVVARVSGRVGREDQSIRW
jgi:signal transduction histidine kinase